MIRTTVLLALLVIAGCASQPAEDREMVTWYAMNSGGAMRVVIYDMVCGRRMGNVRLSGRRETAITTCANEEGLADVRYRPDVYANQSEGWTRRSNVRANQRIYVQ